jgi:hypothetical protein
MNRSRSCRLIVGLGLLVALSACVETTAASTTTTSVVATTTTEATTTTTTLPAATTTTMAASTTALPPSRPLPFDSWTAVLASLPIDEHSPTQARAFADKFGLAGAGVLLSDDYPSLNPGFWVVYTQPYEFSWEAVHACNDIGDVVPDCYARYLGTDRNDPIGYPNGTILAETEDARLVVISLATGDVLRTVDPTFGGDGTFPGQATLAADGQTIDFSVGSEDYWFSCEASVGHLERLDLATGRSDKSGDGFAPVVSPDGLTLAYLASSDCFPDPSEPEFVLAPADTIVLRDVATGRESRQTVPLEGDVVMGYELSDLAWGVDELFVLDTTGTIWAYPIDDLDPGTEPLIDLATLGLDAGGYRLVGYDTTRQRLVITYTFFDTDSQFTELYVVDPAADAVELLEAHEGMVAFALDRTGEHMATAVEGMLSADGQEVEVTVRITALAW